ncbi:hypothetical protein Nepgr_016251 [Nepenthes gracilis]|uniref:Uncharacterized protein n=1 Tax=Nepenthes gracilis TaxID=150966 RepID=A0AAD3SPC2_NEPGR|nr:hypothetical protein Nepgr_016251 [Nepenthes gracilis]
MCSCFSESSRANTLSLSTSANVRTKGDLCINHILAPLMDSLGNCEVAKHLIQFHCTIRWKEARGLQMSGMTSHNLVIHGPYTPENVAAPCQYKMERGGGCICDGPSIEPDAPVTGD